MPIVVGACSDVGRVRLQNEDSFLVGENLWAVADGMGGQAAGDVASNIVSTRLREFDERCGGTASESDVSSLLASINDEVLEYGVRNPAARGLGSTVAGIVRIYLAGCEHWLLFHVGDTRVYRYFDNELVLHTTDHNEAAELAAMGSISEDEMQNHPGRSILTRSLGQKTTPVPSFRLLPHTDGEILIICSDGLSSEATDDEISAVLSSEGSPDQIASDLVRLALEHGGRDNVTVVVVANNVDGWEPTRVDEKTIPNRNASVATTIPNVRALVRNE